MPSHKAHIKIAQDINKKTRKCVSLNLNGAIVEDIYNFHS